MKTVFGPVQLVAVETRQVAPAQHAPLGCGQGFTAQEEGNAWGTPPPVVQTCAVDVVHAPDAQQQAMLGCGQGLDTQVVPAASCVPPHAPTFVTVHVPAAAQHAAVAGAHGPGLQAPP